MARQTPKSHHPKKPAPPAKKGSDNSALVGFVWRNAVVLAGLAIIYVVFHGMFDKERNFDAQRQLYSDMVNNYNNAIAQYQQLRASNASPEEVNNKISFIQNLQGELQTMQGQLGTMQEDLAGDTSYMKKLTRGYQWAVRQMALGSMETVHYYDSVFHAQKIDTDPQKVLDEKMRMKVGVYNLLDYVNKTTPKDAVILLPFGDSVLSNTGKWNFIYDPEWVEYFIYPRLCVASSLGNNQNPELAKRITHVLIVQRRGYNQLKYDVSKVFNIPADSLPQDIVLPVNTPPSQLKTPY